MNRRTIVARILLLDGVLLLVVAVLYFVLTGLATKWLTYKLTPDEYSEVAPQYLVNHIAIGILIIPLALTTLYASWGVQKGQQWSRIVSVINGVSVLLLPVILSWFMGTQYYGSIVFLLATVLIVVIGITMLVPLFWFPKDITKGPEHVQPGQQNASTK